MMAKKVGTGIAMFFALFCTILILKIPRNAVISQETIVHQLINGNQCNKMLTAVAVAKAYSDKYARDFDAVVTNFS